MTNDDAIIRECPKCGGWRKFGSAQGRCGPCLRQFGPPGAVNYTPPPKKPKQKKPEQKKPEQKKPKTVTVRICKICGRSVRLRVDGTIGAHTRGGGLRCGGTGGKPITQQRLKNRASALYDTSVRTTSSGLPGHGKKR